MYQYSNDFFKIFYIWYIDLEQPNNNLKEKEITKEEKKQKMEKKKKKNCRRKKMKRKSKPEIFFRNSQFHGLFDFVTGDINILVFCYICENFSI